MKKTLLFTLLSMLSSVGTWAVPSLVSGEETTIIDLSQVVAEVTAKNGDVLTGTPAVPVKVFIADGATVTLKNVTVGCLDENYDELYSWAGITCQGDATIILEGENYVCAYYFSCPGIQVGPTGKTLTIKGSGSLTAEGLTHGAGIGCGYLGSCGNIVIEGGNIKAIPGSAAGAAGIGSAEDASCGDITISGGTIDAKCSTGGASIGGGGDGSCGNITITEGITKVVAEDGGMSNEYIGKGYDGTCGTITISSELNHVVDGRVHTLTPKVNAIESVATAAVDGAWYTLSGVKLQSEPTAHGIYVKDGRTVVIK
ncbi:MAG: hypothetical protein K6A93_01645 [Bacteroidaceae bacterium]|nr:hypothetical protein [Bacteroidaceae bacterium]